MGIEQLTFPRHIKRLGGNEKLIESYTIELEKILIEGLKTKDYVILDDLAAVTFIFQDRSDYSWMLSRMCSYNGIGSQYLDENGNIPRAHDDLHFSVEEKRKTLGGITPYFNDQNFFTKNPPVAIKFFKHPKPNVVEDHSVANDFNKNDWILKLSDDQLKKYIYNRENPHR